MKYLIKIDRNSIKENPNAGKRHYDLPGRPEVYKEYDSQGNLIRIQQSIPIQRVYSLSPQPKYYYNFIRTIVKCDSCNQEFYHDELESDEDYESWSNTICPKCGSWNCCELEFEKLNVTR